MPTISAHVEENFAESVANAARSSEQKKPGPWIAEACRQRLEREGLMPGNPNAEILAAAQEIGVEKSVEILRRAARRDRSEKKAA